MSLIDDDDAMFRRPRKQTSLLKRAVAATNRESALDLVVMDGAVKTVSEILIDNGGMIQHELHIIEYPFDDDADTSDDVDQLTEIGEEDVAELEEDVEEEEAPEEAKEEAPDEKDNSDSGDPSIPFGEFLDLMEVF